MSSNFQQPPAADVLADLPDDAPIPDLSTYTMGDLRQLLSKEEAFVPKARVRTGSYPDNSITTPKIKDKNVTARKHSDLTFANVPRLLYVLTGGNSDDDPGQQWVPTGGWAAFGHSWAYWAGVNALPSPVSVPELCDENITAEVKTMFTREYFMSFQFWYNSAAVATTGFNVALRLTDGSQSATILSTSDPSTPYNASRDVEFITGWGANSALDSLANKHYYVDQLSNYTGTQPTCWMRQITVWGRYVRRPEYS